MIKLLSLFSGIGAFEKALERIGEPFVTVNYCEIDKYAAKAYSLIHNTEESKNLKDVTKIDTDLLSDDLDLITYGFPCQDISLAGKQKGFKNEDGSLTRSGLFFEALRIIEATKPKFAIAENVKALTDKTFETEFQIVLDSLEDAGYKNYFSVLNAKDYGIPQNRERVFIISIRKDIDNGFCFPKSFELKHRLKDLLENKVDDKYYLSERIMQFFIQNEIKQKERGNGFRFNVSDGNVIASTVTTLAGHRMDDNFINETPNRLFNIYGYDGGSYAGNVYDSEGLYPALLTMQGGNKQPMIVDKFLPVEETTKKGSKIINAGNYSPSNHNASRVVNPEGLAPTVMENHGTVTAIQIKEATEKGYKEAYEGDYVNLQYPNSETRRGRVGEQIANTLLCNDQNGVVEYSKIRKLTPKECFRLMGFDDKDVDILAENKISNAQLYKMAGNSIVVDVLEYLFKALFMQYGDQLQIAAEIEPIELEPMILDFRQITFADLLDNTDSGLLTED